MCRRKPIIAAGCPFCGRCPKYEHILSIGYAVRCGRRSCPFVCTAWYKTLRRAVAVWSKRYRGNAEHALIEEDQDA